MEHVSTFDEGVIPRVHAIIVVQINQDFSLCVVKQVQKLLEELARLRKIVSA